MTCPSLVATVAVCAALACHAQETQTLPTGKRITPMGSHADVGSFPCNMLPVHGGRYVVVSTSGFRQALTVLSTADGSITGKLEISGTRSGVREGLYYGLTSAPGSDDSELIYVSRGSEERVHAYAVSTEGRLINTERSVDASPPKKPGQPRAVLAGVARNSDGTRLYVADNNTTRFSGHRGALLALDTASGKLTASSDTPGFPFAVAAVTVGPDRDRKIYVSSERDAVISVREAPSLREVRQLRTGAGPVCLLLDRLQRRMFVSNSGSDTLAIVDTTTDRVIATILLRPNDLRGLPGTTPLGIALSPDERRAYVALADMNAVAVVDIPARRLIGYLPTGWYPTAVAVSPDGKRLIVANGKGIKPRNPNAKPAGPGGVWGQYIPNIIEGCVSLIALPDDAELPVHTRTVLANNRVTDARRTTFRNPGIKHVFYILKENRTYDQMFGDMTQGNGDPSVCLFPRDVTPNQHALAERFGLFDNFYCCAEVSADGWNWSTSGMAGEYTVRNGLYSYGGRGRSYDYEGANNGSPVDLLGLPDVAMAPGGYIWDACLRKGVSFRNYGFFVSSISSGEKGPEGTSLSSPNAALRRTLKPRTDESFLQFDMSYADSDAWSTYDCPAPRQMKAFGVRKAPSRFAEWKAEFDEYVRKGNLPRFVMIRLPRDHTQGTSVGFSSPRAMVADNDFAVGQVVEAVSNSPYWRSSAIVIIEDDAQNGHDHVDAHRSICLVVSPYSQRGALHSGFYNTDSALRTMELLLGLPPMCQYDAVAPPIACFTQKADNSEPYRAILPARSIVAEVNGATAYRAEDSARLNFAEADAVPDSILSNIIWGAVKGTGTPEPPVRKGLSVAPPVASRPTPPDKGKQDQ